MRYLALDIGAGGVKYALAEKVSGSLRIEKAQQFRINIERMNGHLFWPIDAIFSSLVGAIREAGPVDVISLDSFASDFVLLDEKDEIIGGAVSYLDERTDRIVGQPDRAWIFSRTGCHGRTTSTLYQLLAIKEEEGEILDRAVCLMFLPDYLNYLLTGVKKTSLSMALTSSLINIESLDWDDEIIASLGFKRSLFLPVSKDGESVGMLKDDVEKEVGFSAEVLLSGHDTSLAYIAAAMDSETIMLSVGGFARMGTAVDDFLLSEEARENGYTNAVIPGGRKSLTKYLMGTYLIQLLKGRMKEGTSYDEIMRRARGVRYPYTIDVAKLDFKNGDILDGLNKMLEEKGLPSLADEFEAASLVYSSLASYYKREVDVFENTLSRRFSRIFLLGGGAKDSYLAMLIAMKTGKEVIAGTVNAALVGNLVFQMLQKGEISPEEKDEEIRKAVGRTIYRIAR